MYVIVRRCINDLGDKTPFNLYYQENGTWCSGDLRSRQRVKTYKRMRNAQNSRNSITTSFDNQTDVIALEEADDWVQKNVAEQGIKT